MIVRSSLADNSNSIYLPFTEIIVAVALILEPRGLAAVWFMFIAVPTDVNPSSKVSDKTLHAARSISAIIIGVANTSKLPQPIAFAVLVFSTVTVTVAVFPRVTFVSAILP